MPCRTCSQGRHVGPPVGSKVGSGQIDHQHSPLSLVCIGTVTLRCEKCSNENGDEQAKDLI